MSPPCCAERSASRRRAASRLVPGSPGRRPRATTVLPPCILPARRRPPTRHRRGPGSVSRPSSLWRPTKCAWMFGRRPGAPCSDTANTSVPWKDLYAGHLWHRGCTVLDVTDPSKPSVANFVPGPANTWTIQMEIGDGKMITALEKIAPGWGGDPVQPNDEGVLIWSLADPVRPQRLGQYKTGGTGTHRNFYADGRYMHLAAGMPGYSGNIYVIVDISNPANPVEAGRWWVPGQHTAGGETPNRNVSVHGPPYVEGTRVYIPYGEAGLVILDISDVARPKFVGQLPFTPPFLGFIGAHSVLPVPSRKIAVVNSEAIQEDCQEPLNHASVVDIADPTNPTLLSLFPLPVPPSGSPHKNFCEKGGRFGPHNVHQLYHNPFAEHSDRIVYLTYFNAVLRLVDIADARLPREVGYFIPT